MNSCVICSDGDLQSLNRFAATPFTMCKLLVEFWADPKELILILLHKLITIRTKLFFLAYVVIYVCN